MKNKITSTACRFLLLALFGLTVLLSGCGSTPVKQVKTSDKPLTPESTTKEVVQDILDPLAQTQYQMAIEAINKGEYKQASKTLKKLNRSAPSHAGITANMAVIAYKQQQFDDALELVKEALALDPIHALAYNINGLLATKKGDITGAEQAYLLAIKYDDKYANAYYNIALIYDTYYQDITTALKYYKAYLVLSGFKDNDTKIWIEQLERSAKAGN